MVTKLNFADMCRLMTPPVGGSLERLSPLLAGRQGKGSRLRGHIRARLGAVVRT